MSKLYDAAQFYKENLLNRQFHLRAGKKGNIIEFDIIFSAREFKHLAGLHKLTDLPEVQARSSAVLLQQILNKQITFENIARSEFIHQCEPRLDNFKETKAALCGKELMIKSLHGEFNSIRADFMLTHKDDKFGYAHLFLKETEKDAITVPVTFIINSNNRYLQNNPNRWTVLSVEEVNTSFDKATPKQEQQEEHKIEMPTLTSSDNSLVKRISDSAKGKQFNDYISGRSIIDKNQASNFVLRTLAFFSNFDRGAMERIFKNTKLYDGDDKKLNKTIGEVIAGFFSGSGSGGGAGSGAAKGRGNGGDNYR